MIRNGKDKLLRDQGYKQHAFNVLVSNRIKPNRTLPQTRHKLCPEQYKTDNLPTVSIVMCFYNEHLETLIRSVATILLRTPHHLLHEIILVDDHSVSSEYHPGLMDRLKALNATGKVQLLRNEKREGLIRSRVYGSRRATGQVLVFLDSHIEVNEMWAEPLLVVIKRNSSVLAMPVIDLINPDTFGYSSSPLVRGGFNFGLHFKWDQLPEGTLEEEEDFVGPFKSPTMAGGLFAVDRKYFKEMGEYDMGKLILYTIMFFIL